VRQLVSNRKSLLGQVHFLILEKRYLDRSFIPFCFLLIQTTHTNTIMRISQLTQSLAVLFSFGTASAFVVPSLKLRSHHRTFLASFIEAGGRSKDEIASELESGKLLEGGQVIDFSAVKGTSRAEEALLHARESLNGHTGHSGHTVVVPAAILGINDDVIQEVGHDLGTFADPQTVQQCAAYLRSLAPQGLFEQKEGVHDPTSFTDDDKAKFQQLIEKAYKESGEVTGAFAKTFYMGTQLLAEEPRRAIWAIYVWCRRTDEIVDAPRDNDEDMLYDLSAWEMRLENLWKYGQVEDVFDLCLLDVRRKYPKLQITPFVDMIRGMLMDVPGLGQDRYDNFDELHLYCYRVAGTVGLMSMPVFGCAPGFTEEQAK
jgi:phytoene synthase